jgi:hypothetical protein
MDRKGGLVDWNDLTEEEKASAVPLRDYIDKFTGSPGDWEIRNAAGELVVEKTPDVEDRRTVPEPPKEPTIHLDEGKPRVDLIPVWSLLEIGRVMEYGVHKYGEHNWSKHAGRWAWTKLIGSALRHIFSWMRREDFDEESGLPHLAHAIVNLMMLLDLQSTGSGKDDRNPLYKQDEEIPF